MYDNDLSIEVLVGETLAAVEVADDKETITFKTVEGAAFRLCHEQDCCESVAVEDVVGDLADLIGSPILRAEERTSDESDDVSKKPSEYSDSWTWTLYELATVKGSVTIRWLGESNGYYSESVTFSKVAA